jgi:D-glycero-D-manno-heptose 1,7-bisphosphate phosphatase
MMTNARRGAIFFDRDGVLNEDRHYVHRIEDFRWTEGAREAVKIVNDAGLLAIVATNQSGVARGYFREEDVHALHAFMARDLAAIGARIDAFYLCPYHDDAKLPAYRVADHPDRKPNPGMILKGLHDFAIDPRWAMIIGDKPSDLEAGRRAGIAGRLFEGGSLAVAVSAALASLAG